MNDKVIQLPGAETTILTNHEIEETIRFLIRVCDAAEIAITVCIVEKDEVAYFNSAFAHENVSDMADIMRDALKNLRSEALIELELE